jgi:NAD(P)-dependent dehydrogenase (short-subunit alcohol dehydrogenase family)
MLQELLARGAAKVHATSRSPQPQTEGRIVPRVLDVTDDDFVAAAARTAADVSSVVSNAGDGRGQPDPRPRREQLYDGPPGAGH